MCIKCYHVFLLFYLSQYANFTWKIPFPCYLTREEIVIIFNGYLMRTPVYLMKENQKHVSALQIWAPKGYLYMSLKINALEP